MRIVEVVLQEDAWVGFEGWAGCRAHVEAVLFGARLEKDAARLERCEFKSAEKVA